MANNTSNTQTPVDGSQGEASTYREEYIKRIEEQANVPVHHTLYPWQWYRVFAKYLREPPLLCRENGVSHAVLYSLGAKQDVQYFNDSDECANALYKRGNTSPLQTSQILFLRGISSPEWISMIGAKCNTDHEFLYNNIRLQSEGSDFSCPSLPSASAQTVRLRLTTIGSPEPMAGQSGFDATQFRRALFEYGERHILVDWKIREAGRYRLSDSIIRKFHFLNERWTAIDQEIAICMHFYSKPHEPGGSWLALVCQDSGNSLIYNHLKPWLPSRVTEVTSFHPTIQHQKHSVKGEYKLDVEPRILERETFGYSHLPQTAALLGLNYGRFSDPAVMAQDPFYALDEVFKMCAASENQFLSAIKAALEEDIEHASRESDKSTTVSASSFLYFRRLLHERTKYLEGVIDFIRQRYERPWLGGSVESRHSIAKAAHQALILDYKELLKCAQSLNLQCSAGLDLYNQSLVMTDTKEAILLTRTLQRLSLMGFVYIALSFTTSIFGMNLVELGQQGGSNFRVWASISFPVAALTILLALMKRSWISDLRFWIRYSRPTRGWWRTYFAVMYALKRKVRRVRRYLTGQRPSNSAL